MTLTRRALMASTLAAALGPPDKAQAQAQQGATLTARKGRMRLRPDPAPESDILSFGPTPFSLVLRGKLGDLLKIRLDNRLDTPLALHWRGVRLPNAFDGASPRTQKPVAPSDGFDLAFTPPEHLT